MSGPIPTHCPVFPEAFLEQARLEVHRRTLPYQRIQRYQLVLLLHEYPHLSHQEAGQQVGLSGRQVQRWRQRWAAGEFVVTDRAGRGRKATFSPSGTSAGESAGVRSRGRDRATAEPTVAGRYHRPGTTGAAATDQS